VVDSTFFVPGDVVQLKSGGPRMTVMIALRRGDRIRSGGFMAADTVKVVFFSDGRYIEQWINNPTRVLIKEI
jgi:hypothetical protein